MQCDANPTVLCERCNLHFIPQPPKHPVSLDTLRFHGSPTPVEASQTAELLKTEELELKKYEEQLKRLRSITEKLEREKAALSRRIQNRRCWLAPIRKLPLEIFGKIFQVLIASESSSLVVRDQGKTIHAYPYVLSQVESLWRDIVTSHPQFWTSIDIDVHFLGRDIQPLLQTYLYRSEGQTLNVKISDSEKYAQSSRSSYGIHLGRHGVSACQTLLEQASRVEVFSFNVNEAFFLEKLLSRPARNSLSFPVLREFRNYSGFHWVSGESMWFWKQIHHAPMLTSVMSLHPHEDIVLPFSQLTSITIAQLGKEDPSYDSGIFRGMAPLLRILSSCPRLQHLEIGEICSEQLSSPTIKFTLPSLRYLSVQTNDKPTVFDPLFNCITMPSLEVLEVTSTLRQKLKDWPNQPFIGLVRRSGSLLNMQSITLSFPFASLPPDRCEELLSLLPTSTRVTARVANIRSIGAVVWAGQNITVE
uniref:F-box domain-containing protein n=1 Tax=Moniliophthora roreri TaxID=221103 RepID=A0A0W0GAS2_MONRR